MAALRVFPFIGAAIAVIAVVFAIIGVSTTYWFTPAIGGHAGLWQTCPVGDVCVSHNGGRPAALALTVR